MTITLLGSTGFLGRVLLEQALDAGYRVRTLVRDPERLGGFRDRVEYVKGNVFEPDDVAEAIRGAEAVLSTVGPSQWNPGDPTKYGAAMRQLVRCLQDQGITRYIHVGGAAHAGGEDEVWTLGRRFLRVFLTLLFKDGLIAKHLEWEVLRSSDLEWTLVRPPGISTSPPRGSLVADEKDLASLRVNVADLAEFMLLQIRSRDWIRRAPLVAAGPRRVKARFRGASPMSMRTQQEG